MDLGVRPPSQAQPQMVWEEDDLGPETDVDNPEAPRDSRPESSQGEPADATSESEEDEWKYVKPKKDSTHLPASLEAASHLNPNATEFVPVFPSLENEVFIACSPNINNASTTKNFEEVEVPSKDEFDHGISTVDCDLGEGGVEIKGIAPLDKTCEEPKTDVSFNASDVSDKVDTNPFASDMIATTRETGQIEFDQNYFGSSAPFNAEVKNDFEKDSYFDNQLVHKNLSSVAEESSSFNLIETHFDVDDTVSGESEKERNQLEIKEPESPVHSVIYGVKETSDQFQVDDERVDSTLSHQLQTVIISEEPENVQTDQVDRVVSQEDPSFEINSDVIRVPSEVKDEEELKQEEVSENTTLTTPDVLVDTNVDVINEVITDALKENPLVSNFVNEVLSDIPQIEKDYRSSDHYINSHVDNDLDLNEIDPSSQNQIVLENEHEVDESNYEIKQLNDVQNFEKQETEVEENLPAENEKYLSNVETSEVDMDSVGFSVPETETTVFDKKSDDIVVDYFDHPSESHMELADTIGPNSFSFSQPYESQKQGTLLTDFMGLKKNDIMTTSMHESLEPESSFEFISDNTLKETVMDNIANDKNFSSLTERIIPEPVNNSTVDKLTNGIDTFSSIIKLEECVKPDVVQVTESAIIESHEVPVSSEPDLVFVEQICPTVEVKSDDASPINKEVSGFDLTSTVGIAAAATVAATAVAVTSLSNYTEPNSTKKDEVEVPTKAPISKAPITKKPATTASKTTTSKAPTTKTTGTKPLAAPAKPRVPGAVKTSTLTTRTKPALSTAKTSATDAAKSSAAKPPVKSSVTAVSKVPPKVPAPRPAVGTTRPAARPLSAPPKTTTLSAKPSPPKPLSSAPRVPLAAKKPAVPSSKLTTATKPASLTESKTTVRQPLTKPAAPTAKPPLKTASTIGAKPPTKLGISAAPASRPKAASPTKPAPIKAKSPLAITKRPASAPIKKTSTVSDKNAKNAVKCVPKPSAPQKEVITSENVVVEVSDTPTTNGHHIENGNLTPMEEVPSQIV